MQPDKPGMRYHYEGGTMRYHATGPMQPGINGAKLRAGRPQAHGRSTCHYEGEEGAEHKVYFTTSSGDVVHYKGKKSEEYMVCLKMLYGGLLHYKGECRGAERPARYELPYGGSDADLRLGAMAAVAAKARAGAVRAVAAGDTREIGGGEGAGGGGGGGGCGHGGSGKGKGGARAGAVAARAARGAR
eukprot:scaffold1541_cov67-Phaeocystis_antarctica.AAC.3